MFSKKIATLLKNKFLINTLITLFLRVLGVLTLFISTLFITNNYNNTIVGEYEIVRVFLVVLGSIGLLGTEHSILYFAGKYRSLQNEEGIKLVYYKMIQLLAISSIILITVYLLIPKHFILSFYNNDEITYTNIKNCFVVLFFYILTLLNTEMLRAINFIYISEIFRNTLKFLPLILGSIVLLYYGNPHWLINFYLYGFVVLSLITTSIILLHFRKMNKSFESNNLPLVDIFKTSYPMAISGLCFFLMLFFDVMLLKKYYSSDEVAYYSIAVKMFTILSMVIVAININVAPNIAEYVSSKNKLELKKILNRSRKIICLINIPTGLFLIAFGKSILSFFGDNYVNAYSAMVIIVIAQMIASLFGSIAIILNMANKQHLFKNILLVSTFINLTLNIILIPGYGMIGAAISLAISLLLWNLISYYYYKKTIHG